MSVTIEDINRTIEAATTKEEVEKAVGALYEKFDLNKSGTLDRAECFELLKQSCPKMSTQDLEEYTDDFIPYMDRNGDGEISFDEYVNLVCRYLKR